MRRASSRECAPSPGPYSAITRARAKSTLSATLSTKALELGIIDATCRGLCRKRLKKSALIGAEIVHCRFRIVQSGVPACCGARVANERFLGEDKSGQPTVLVVDDDESLQNLFKLFLKKIGFSRVVVGTVKEALAALDKQKFDLIFLDLKLPDGPADDVYDTAKQEQPECP